MKRRGFSMVEVVVSTAIVGLMLTAAIAAVGASVMRRADTADRSMASYLGRSLMDEMDRKPYEAGGAADGGSLSVSVTVVGELETPGAGDGGSGSDGRAGYSTLDSYSGLVDAPPTRADGTKIDGGSGFSRTVDIAIVDANNPALMSASDTGVKLVTVTVKKRGETLAVMKTLRTRVMDGSRR